jgi:hypothetical protein
VPDLLLGRVGIALQEIGGGHDHPRRAVAALQAVVVPEGLLERVQLVAVGHALDGLDLGAVGLDGKHRAALHRVAVDVHRARAAVGGVTADVRAGQTQVVAQQMDQEQTRLDFDLVVLPVDGEAHGNGAHTSPLSSDAGCSRAYYESLHAHKCARGALGRDGA